MKKYAFINRTAIWTVEFKENNELEINKLLKSNDGGLVSTPIDLYELSENYESMAQKLVFQCLDKCIKIMDIYSHVIIEQDLSLTPINWDEHQELLKLLTTLAI